MLGTNLAKAAAGVNTEVGNLSARPKDPFVGFSQLFGENNSAAAGIICEHLAFVRNSSGQSGAGPAVGFDPVVFEGHMAELKDLSMIAGMRRDETSAAIIAAARDIIRSAHARGPNLTNGEVAKLLSSRIERRAAANEKLKGLGRLANGQSILTTEDKVMVGLIFTVGGAGLTLGVVGMVGGGPTLPALAFSAMGAALIWMGKLCWKQAHDFAVDQLR